MLERGQLGERARSEQHRGWTLNLGPHALYADGGGAALLDRMGVARDGGAPVLEGAKVLLDGRLQPFPLSPVGLLRSPLMGVRERVRFAAALASATRGWTHSALAPVEIGTWMDDHLGSDTTARALFGAAAGRRLGRASRSAG